MSVINEISLAEEENAANNAYTKEEEELRQTELERQMEAAAEAAEIDERGMKEVAKATAFLLLLVGVRTDRCKMF